MTGMNIRLYARYLCSRDALDNRGNIDWNGFINDFMENIHIIKIKPKW